MLKDVVVVVVGEEDYFSIDFRATVSKVSELWITLVLCFLSFVCTFFLRVVGVVRGDGEEKGGFNLLSSLQNM